MNRQEAYSILGVSENTSEEELKKVYRKLAKAHHPDTNQGSKESEEKFKKINEAYSQLTHADQENLDLANFRFDEMFSNIFGGKPGGMGGMGMRIVNTVYIHPETFINGGTIPVQVMNKQQNLVIEADTPVMTQIALQSNHFIQLVPMSSPRYTVTDMIHLTQTHRISVFRAMLGGDLEIKSPKGKTLKVHIAAGTQAGSIYRLRGNGLKTPQGMYGDLNIVLAVHIPMISGKDNDEIIDNVAKELKKHL